MSSLSLPSRPITAFRQVSVVCFVIAALLASTVGVAEASTTQTTSTQIEELRLACSPKLLDGERGVLCRWSESEAPNVRAYQLYRIVDGSPRELLTTVTASNRLGFFDTDVTAPSSIVYGVIAVNRAGRLIALGAPEHVELGR